jgi:hypothetical protein
LLALVETVNALVAPLFAPTETDWISAAAKVRAGFRPGDLIVAAPTWADPLMREQLGNLVPLTIAGRMDAARYGRIWEISQRGERSDDTATAHITSKSRHGALVVKLWERRPAHVSFDFLAEWRRANMFVVRPGKGEVACGLGEDRHLCLDGTFVKPQLLEIDTRLRNALSVVPLDQATIVLDYPDVPLGQELVVGAGLHNVWLRKSGDGKVRLRILVDGLELGRMEAASLSGWTLRSFNTTAKAGRRARVRFEIETDRAQARQLGFTAEARTP